MSKYIYIIIAIVSFFVIYNILKFRRAQKIDNERLKKQSLEKKFSLLINGLNEYCYQGEGEIIKHDARNLNIYKNESCQIVHLQYGVGMLTIVWKFKYYLQEMIFKKDLYGANEVSEEWQRKNLQTIINEFIAQYEIHEAKVNSSGIINTILAEIGISPENLKNAKDFFN